MSTLPKSRLRIAGDFFRFTRLVDLLRPAQTNPFEEEIPFMPRFHGADSLQVEVAVFNDGTLLTDLSAITELELVIKPLRAIDPLATDPDDPNPDAVRGPASNVAPIVCKRIGSEHFNVSLTDIEWQSKAANKAHAIIHLDSEEAALSPGERWLSLIALGADGQARTLAAGPVLILGGGPTFNALPQPIVKDLRDQAAQSAAQAQHSADNAATEAQQAATAASTAQAQVVLASAAATEAGTSAAAAQLAATQATQARDAAQQSSGDAQVFAQAAEQTANRIGDLDTALLQAASDADRAHTAAEQAEASKLAAEMYAQTTNANTKEATGGVHFEFGAPTAVIPIKPSHLSAVTGFTFSCMFQISERGAAAGNRCIVGSLRGISTLHTGGIGLSVSAGGSIRWDNEKGGSALNTIQVSGAQGVSGLYHAIAKYDPATQAAVIKLADGSLTTAQWSEVALTSTRDMTLMLAASQGASGNDLDRSAAGTIHHLAIFSRPTTDEEDLSLFAAGGRIVPLSARSALLIDLAMDEGTGYQLRDRSGNGNHALLTASGCTHLKPGERFEFSWTRISSGFLGNADRPVLFEGAVIESIIWEDAKATRTTASLGSHASNTAAHVASFTPSQSRQAAVLEAGSMAVADRRLYLHMSANAGAVTIHVKGRVL